MTPLTDADLAAISARTLSHYDRNADVFREGTRDHDVSQNYAALLEAIEAEKPYSILDFGCGPGRDLAYFASLGHEAIGIDGSANFVALARQHSGCEVWQQDFLRLSLPSERFDGIFANASLFHVPRQEIDRVLRELAQALRPRGVLFSSNPRGQDQEGWSGNRYATYYTLETWRALATAAGFEFERHYYRPEGRPRAEQPWLATVLRKRDPISASRP